MLEQMNMLGDQMNASHTGSIIAVRSPSGRLCGVVALAATLLAGNVHAGWDTTYRTITHIYSHNDGVTFNVGGSVIVPTSPCGNRFILSTSSPNYAAKVGALLSLHAQGRRVQIYYDSASTACDIPVSAFISEP